METDSYTTTLGTGGSGDWAGTLATVGALEEGSGGGSQGSVGSSSSTPAWYVPYPLGFQVSLTAFLTLELVLGFSSNLTVLALYCSQRNLVDSVSNAVTVNLHVVDAAVCALCLPLTLALVLLPPGPGLPLLCLFHEAGVTFAGVATAVNVLVVSVDRYDISVRPANRLLTPRRAALLLAAVWVTSVAVFFIPFLEVEFFSRPVVESESGQPSPASTSSSTSPPATTTTTTLVPVWHNRTLLCVGRHGYHTGLGVYYHLLLQVPIFFATVAVMMFTYSRILRALNIRIGSHIKSQRFRFRGPSSCRGGRRKRQKKKKKKAAAGGREGVIEGAEEQCCSSNTTTKHLSHPPLIPSLSTTSPTPTPTPTSPPPVSPTAPLVSSEGAAAPVPATLGVQASVSAIIALRRAVRRHRDRRRRQRRVFKMSLLIVSTFLGCWLPLSVANMLILALGPSDTLVSLRLWFLALAYGTTVVHPLLYAFTRQKLRRALRAKVKKRVVSLLQVDPSPGGTVIIHNSWVEPRKGGRKGRLETSDATDRCLAEPL